MKITRWTSVVREVIRHGDGSHNVTVIFADGHEGGFHATQKFQVAEPDWTKETTR